MRLLDVTIDLGRGAAPADLEAIVRGLRVAVDVAHSAELRRLRRSISEQMKYPTDSELAQAAESREQGDEQSPAYRAKMQLDARRMLREDMRGGPPEWWFDPLYRKSGLYSDKPRFAFKLSGYERAFQASPLPFAPGAFGLDVADPVLYQALVAEALSRLAPGPVGVHEMRYANPFFKRLFGKGETEKTISTTAQVLETVCTLGSTRKMAKADAAVAERTVRDRVADSQLDVERKRVALERDQQALLKEKLENLRTLEGLSEDRARPWLVDAAIGAGLLDIADAVDALSRADAAALAGLARRPIELEERGEPDDALDVAEE